MESTLPGSSQEDSKSTSAASAHQEDDALLQPVARSVSRSAQIAADDAAAMQEHVPDSIMPVPPSRPASALASAVNSRRARRPQSPTVDNTPAYERAPSRSQTRNADEMVLMPGVRSQTPEQQQASEPFIAQIAPSSSVHSRIGSPALIQRPSSAKRPSAVLTTSISRGAALNTMEPSSEVLMPSSPNAESKYEIDESNPFNSTGMFSRMPTRPSSAKSPLPLGLSQPLEDQLSATLQPMSGGERDTARDRMDEQDNRSVVSALSFDNIMFDPETQNARAQSGWNAIQSLKFQVCHITYTVLPYNRATNRSLCKLAVLMSYVMGKCMITDATRTHSRVRASVCRGRHIPAY